MCGCREPSAANPKALPIDQWLESNGGSALLTGPWEFYWNVLLNPGDSLPQDVSQLAMGRIWNGFVQSSGLVTPSRGSATYRYVLRDLPARPDGYSFTFRYALTSYRAIIFPESRPEEARVVTSGIVSLTRDEAVPSRKWNFVSFGSDRTENWVVLVQVSNHHHELGGFREAPILSLGRTYQKRFELQQIGTFICLGAMAAVAFYSLMLHLRRRSDHAALMLACVATFVIIRVIFYNPVLYQYFPDTESFFKIQLQMDFITASLSVAFYIMFLHSSLTAKLHVWVQRGLVFFNIFYVGFVLAASVDAVTLYRPMLLASLALDVALGAYLLFKSLYQRADGVSYIFAGTLVAFLAMVHDSLIPAGIVSSTHIIQFGLTIFLVIHNQLVVRRSAQAFTHAESLAATLNIKNAEIEAFNQNLQSLVDFKSREVRTILDHIPQGVLLIGKEAKVTGDYSANLVELIGTRDIAGQSVMDLIFKNSDLDSDSRDRLHHSLRAAIGTRRFSFDVNSDNLPKAFALHLEGRTRHIKATWTVLTHHGGLVEFILLTLLDVSSELAAAKQNETRLREFEIVRQLLLIEPREAAGFFASCGAILEKCQHLLAPGGASSGDMIIRQLLIHVHTMKGSARSLNLMNLANVLHKAEDGFQALMQQSPGVDSASLRSEWKTVRECFELHQSINFHQLNRIGGTVAPSPGTLRDLLDRSRQRAIRMAQDLGKEPPLFVLDGVDAPLPESIITLLDQCMIHIVSNALVHGIEAAEERQRAGKDPRGTFRMASVIDGPDLVLRLSDDGRGLAVKELHAAASKFGILSEQSRDGEILETIFTRGVSTAVELSLHAGRGIGLDAVRTVLREAGGTVMIRWDERPGTPDPDRRPFILEIRIPAALQQTG
jgi:HPt (histidine-containing phosphotransfer) domain-containing protein